MSGVRAVVIGVGNEFRSDDGVGPAVATAVEELELPGVSVTLCDGEPAGLLDVWADVELAIVVDAVLCEPSTPGRIWRTTIDALRGVTSAASSHALGVPDALPLGRALGRVPGELVVIAVEAASLELGVGMSEPVAAAVSRVVEAVLTELARLGITTGGVGGHL
ncbi:hydrogenase maturation protease [Nocardia sp. CA-135398]|uniref:hydrogenase maturation protease n=1 Tax=Nocardia sp. CA-135398 TaxID=3239977 RepID=UPI003D9773AB